MLKILSASPYSKLPVTRSTRVMSSNATLTTWQRLAGFAEAVIDHNTVNFWASKLNPLWSINQPMARIVARTEAASNSVTLILKPNRHVVMPQAGQHITVATDINGVRIARSYSTSSVAEQPGLLAITVKQIEDGRLSNWLCLQACEGDVLYLGQPFGDFQWPAQQHPVLLLAAGSGITPMISLLRQYAAQQLPSKQVVQLHYWVRSREEACFIDELLALPKIQPNFSLHVYLTQQNQSQPHEHTGRINASHFSQQEDLSNSHVLACGPSGFVSNAQQILQAQVASFQAEAFSPPQIRPDAHDNETVQITLQRQQRILTIPTGQSILAALEAEGINHPSGCRMGLCNTCACPKVSGTTEHLISGEQQQDENPALRVCVSRARSNLVLDI